jgi:23S rRNA pseudouridine955/2504/2580 synthase
MGSSRRLTAALDDNDRRLDRILRKALPETPLSGIHRLVRKGAVLVDGKPAAPSDRIRAGSIITVPQDGVSYSRDARTPSASTQGKLAASSILWENGDLLALNKPPGLAVHGRKSLEGMVRAYFAGRLRESLSFVPGPLHRLDRPTSGVIVFSVSLEGARYFSALMRENRITKRYLALVDGEVEGPLVWRDSLIRDRSRRTTYVSPDREKEESRYAETSVIPLAVSSSYSLISAEIRTGRTHQIRAQAAFHTHPLAGDKKYGGSFQTHGPLLHAETLRFPENPRFGLPAVLYAPMPERFRARIHGLFKGSLDLIKEL